MNNLLSELNAQYRCEYEEANKRLQNTTKLLTSLLVAITGIITAAVAAFLPACTCNNYSVKPCEIVLFVMNVLSAIIAFGIDSFGLILLRNEERMLVFGNGIGTYSNDSMLKPKKIRNYKMNYEAESNENDGLDLREYYSKKTEKANEINFRRQQRLLLASIFTLLAIILLAGLLTVCIINLMQNK